MTSRDWQLHFRKQFRAKRVLADIEAVWTEAQWNSSVRLAALMKVVAKRMRQAGLCDVEIIEFSSDGRRHYGGWKMPLAWSPRAAALEVLSSNIQLANYRVTPNNLMLYSASTPKRGVEADLVLCPYPLRQESLATVRGKIAFVDKLPNGLEATRALRRAGALGVVTDNIQPIPGVKEGSYLDDAVAFYNYSWPPWSVPARDRGFGFCISPRLGRDLRDFLARGPVRVLAFVDANLNRGTLPLVTGRLPGASGRDIILTGHIDEPGANDNASGPMMALEIARVIRKILFHTPHHGLRLVFSAEARGLQALVNERRDLIRNGILALNLDMLGSDQNEARAQLSVVDNFPALPDPTLPFLLREISRSKTIRWRRQDYELNDNILGEPLLGIPTIQLHQAPDATYHTSLDTPDRISTPAMARLGSILGAHVAFLACAGPREIMEMANAIVESDLPNERERLDGLLRLLPQDNFLPAVDCVRSGAIQLRQDGLTQSEATREAIARLKQKSDPPAASVGAVMRGQKYRFHTLQGVVPQKIFFGYLGGEDLTEAERRRLRRECGVTFGWGATKWLQWALFWSNGKRTLAEILAQLHGAGCEVSGGELLAAFRWLLRKGYVKFRPVIAERDLIRALRRVGVRRGSKLIAHCSLSQFGYIQGGAKTMIRALVSALGRQGTLCMPTHSLNWLGKKPYHPKTSPSVVGAVSDCFRQQSGVVRSNHPTHSVGARGPMARELVAGHDGRVAPQSRDGFWGKFVVADGWVLLMSPLRSNTLMHAAELWSGVPMPDIVVPLRTGKRIRRIILPNAPWHTNYFDRIYRALRRVQRIRSVRLGESRIYLMRARDVMEVAMRVLRRDLLVVTVKGCHCAFCRHIRQARHS